MKTLLLIIALLTFISNFVLAQSGEILISDRIKTTISAELTKLNKTYSIVSRQIEEKQLFFRTWVSGSIELGNAITRESKRFKRTTYKQEIRTERSRLTTERLKINQIRKRTSFWRFWEEKELLLIPQLQIEGLQQLQLEKPVPVLYQEGPTYFKYTNLKEDQPQTAMQESLAIEVAKQFLIENAFVRETDRDKIGTVYVQNRRINMDEGAGRAPQDYLVQQDVVFERHYDNKPVINSKITLGILPDSKEIVLFEHFNWTPLTEEKPSSISKQILTKYGSGSNVEIQRRLEQKIRQTSGTFYKAEINRVIPAWFQTETMLIPVLCFDVYIEHPSPRGILSRNYLEVLNLAGNDEMLLEGRKTVSRPTKAPM